MDIQEVGLKDVDSIDLAEDTERRRAIVNVVMNFRVPLIAGNLLTN
jgi:hypothetical protein